MASHPKLPTNLSPLNRSAFTLVEVVIVTGLILLFSLVTFQTADIINQRKNEDRMRENLLEMRGALDKYHQDNLSFPNTMSALLTTPMAGGGFYLRRFPLNPMFNETKWEVSAKTSLTGTGDIWVEITDPTTTITGPIVDIRCPPSAGTGLNGIAYELW